MSDGDKILSQDEIDALLHGVGSGAVKTQAEAKAVSGPVRAWDPMEGDRVLKSAMPGFDSINERMVRSLTSIFCDLLDCAPEVGLRAVQVRRYGEYTATLGVPAALCMLRATGYPGMMMVAIAPRLVFALVDVFFGGDGQLPDTVAERDFTITEMRVVERVMAQIRKAMIDTWESVLEIDFEVVDYETRPMFVTSFTPHDEIHVVRYGIEVEGKDAELHMVIPASMIDALRPHLAAETAIENDSESAEWVSEFIESVKDAEVDVSGVIAQLSMRLRDLSALRAGDVIPIDLPEEALIYVDAMPMFIGSFGIISGHKAVKINAATHGKAVAGKHIH